MKDIAKCLTPEFPIDYVWARKERPTKSTVKIILIQKSNQEECHSLEGSKLILSY